MKATRIGSVLTKVERAALVLGGLGLLRALRVPAQLLGKPTRPQVETPKGPVRQVIFKSCTSCHGIDDYAYYAMDRGRVERAHRGQAQGLEAPRPDPDRDLLLDWLVTKFGPGTKPFPRTYVAPEITTFFRTPRRRPF